MTLCFRPEIALLASVFMLASCQPAAIVSSRDAKTEVRAYGVFRADEILVSSQTAGTIEWLGANEGSTVSQGDVLARLETNLVDAQIAQAMAALETAKAQLAGVKEGARPEEIAVADSAVRRAEEEVAASEKSVELARGSVAGAEAKLQVALAEQNRINAGASPQDIISAQERAKTAQDRLAPLGRMRENVGGGEQGGILPPGSHDAAQATLAQAELSATIAGLQVENLQAGPHLQDLEAARATVDAARAGLNATQLKVTEAEARLEAARARLRQARAQADLLREGASPEQVAVAEAPVRIAMASLRVLEVRRAQATLTAPRAGLILERNVDVGEEVLVGTVLYHLSDLKTLELTVYVAGGDISRIRAGQGVRITTGSLPGRRFDGEVNHVSPQAEFTPNALNGSGAETSEVFAVTIRVANPDGVLRPGMPSEAEFTGL